MKRILLQSFETGFYLDMDGAWTTKPELARDFANTVQATEFKLHRRLIDTFVVLLPEPMLGAESAAPNDGACVHTKRSHGRVVGWGNPIAPHPAGGHQTAKRIRR
jgi:hypothetical protein